MTSFLEIDGARFAVTSATLELYHCASSEADANLALVTERGPVWLAGVVAPAPRAVADLDGAAIRLEQRSFDEAAEAVTGRPLTSFPVRGDVTLAVEVRGEAVRVHAAFEYDWDRYLEPDAPASAPTRHARLDVIATVAGLHPGNLP